MRKSFMADAASTVRELTLSKKERAQIEVALATIDAQSEEMTTSFQLVQDFIADNNIQLDETQIDANNTLVMRQNASFSYITCITDRSGMGKFNGPEVLDLLGVSLFDVSDIEATSFFVKETTQPIRQMGWGIEKRHESVIAQEDDLYYGGSSSHRTIHDNNGDTEIYQGSQFLESQQFGFDIYGRGRQVDKKQLNRTTVKTEETRISKVDVLQNVINTNKEIIEKIKHMGMHYGMQWGQESQINRDRM